MAQSFISDLRRQVTNLEAKNRHISRELARTYEERDLALRALGCGVGEYDSKIAELRAARDAPITTFGAEWIALPGTMP